MKRVIWFDDLQANTTVTIQNDMGGAVSGATVTGIFTGPTMGTFTGTTNGNGQVIFTSPTKKNPVGEWCFEVTNVSLAGATYNSGANIVTKACESGIVFRTTSGAFANNGNPFNLLGVYPNPFQNSTKISFDLQQQSPVILEVYNVLGERVAVITDRIFDAGQHFLDWNTPEVLGSGTYYLHFKAGDHVDVRKLMLIR